MALEEEKVFLVNTEGKKLCGLFHEPKKSNGTCVILCHGITSNKDECGVFIDVANELAERGFSTFRFDFTAHGESEGESKEVTLYTFVRDIESVVHFLKEEKHATSLATLSASFAGAPTLLYAGENPDLFQAIVLWNPRLDFETLFHPITEMGKKNWGQQVIDNASKTGFHEIQGDEGSFFISQKFVEDMQKYTPWQMLDRIASPVLIVHGDADTFVPYSDSVKYSKMFDLPLVTISGGEHGFIDNYTHELQATHATIDFFQKYLV